MVLGTVKIDYILSSKAEKYRPSEIRELLKLTEGKKVISLAGGLPDPKVFPKRELAEIAKEVIEEFGDRALQYSPTRGVTDFRNTLRKFLIAKGVKVRDEDDIIVTTGSQQSLDLISRMFLESGDDVIVELPSYLAALTAFRANDANLVGVPMDENGMKTDKLEEIVRELVGKGRKIKFIYTVPVAHNPTGITMSLDRKKHLLEIASKYDLLIIEDDPYSYFIYDEGVDVTPLKSLDKEGRVVYLSTFSKILAPGLRIGWLVGPKEFIDYVERCKQTADLHTPTLTQFIAMEAIRKGVVDKTIRRAKEVYRVKRDVMINALSKYMIKGTKWVKPVGGLFVFVWLPSLELNTKKLLPEAIERGVAYVPGAPFFADGMGWNTLRLNFSYPTPEQIEEGVKILGSLIRDKIGG